MLVVLTGVAVVAQPWTQSSHLTSGKVMFLRLVRRSGCSCVHLAKEVYGETTPSWKTFQNGVGCARSTCSGLGRSLSGRDSHTVGGMSES